MRGLTSDEGDSDVALSNRDRVGRGFEVLAQGLGPYLDRRMRTVAGDRWFAEWAAREAGTVELQDPHVQLKVLTTAWDRAFRNELRRSDRSLAFELRDTRNDWAHNRPFSPDDAYRALDSMERLLTAIDAREADEIAAAKQALMEARYASQRRTEQTQTPVITAPAAGLRPWREVVVPHDDVARGKLALSEFAADLHRVAHGEGGMEYVDPVEFFRRTYLTAGLRTILTEAAQRIAGDGATPIRGLMTNFGGGKTHSLIALYHLFSGRRVDELPDEVGQLVRDAGVLDQLPAVRRAVLVGTRIAPGQPSVKDDGIEVRTLWGELAWQLLGRRGVNLIADADRTSTSPGDHLVRVIEEAAPCLVLVDEWVAYARQLVGADGLPAGSFETQFTFAQLLTEAVRSVPGAYLVVSLPASEGDGRNGDPIGSEIETGGPGGREALSRLANVIGRAETAWLPATADEAFEIVRRRLFTELDEAAVADRDAAAGAFGQLYARNASEFPAECREAAYVQRIKAAYPIHPELFARLYEDWSTLEKFQRTRGVLRLMAAVVKALWEAEDQQPLILPSSIPLSDPAVQAELTRNLDDAWKPIIDADIDGEGSLPLQLDRRFAGTLGKFAATRRVARTIFLGSAPTLRSANEGIDAPRVRLGSVLPGQTIAAFGDAMGRLSAEATYLYADGGRYWYSTQASAARTARERAQRLLTESRHEVHEAIERRLHNLASAPGAPFAGVHPCPATTADVVDDPGARLVILRPDTPHLRGSSESAALHEAEQLLKHRGSATRELRNALVFLAADSRRIESLESAVADHRAWSSVVADAESLNLDNHQQATARTRCDDLDRTVALRLADAFVFALVPTQPDPTGKVVWEEVRVDGPGGLVERTGRKLVTEAHLYDVFAPALLRQRLDGPLTTLWLDGWVSVRDLHDAFARYPYLPRLRDLGVLRDCAAGGAASTSWQSDGFAIADGVSEDGTLVGLRADGYTDVAPTSLVVRPDVAVAQLQQTAAQQTEDDDRSDDIGPRGPGSGVGDGRRPADVPPDVPDTSGPRRFHGSVQVDSTRAVRDFDQVVREVVTHLVATLGAEVELRVEIDASHPEGFDDTVVRNVTENARTLRFDGDSGFTD
jgi:predicted AAA+ superfamily ATPase